MLCSKKSSAGRLWTNNEKSEISISRKLIDDNFTTVRSSEMPYNWTQMFEKINTQKAISLAFNITNGLLLDVCKSCQLCNFIVYVWGFTLCGPISISTTEANGHTSLLSIGNTSLKLALRFASGALMCLTCNR